MQLESVTAVLRPRSPWEAADLGCALVRSHYPKVLLLWAITVFPIWAVILFLCRDSLLWGWFWIWLLQPLYGRAQLFYISRALFGDKPAIKEVLRAVPSLWLRNPFYSLTIGRFSLGRSFLLPVLLLERPNWEALRKRGATLRLQGGGAGSLTTTAVFLRISAFLAVLALGRMLVSTGVNPDWRQVFQDMVQAGFLAMVEGELSSAAMWGMTAAYLLSLLLIEPFYIGSGFGEYLDARTHLEGWDVELGFRRIAGRLERIHQPAGGTAAVGFLLGVLLLSGSAPRASAQYSDVSPEEVVQEVLAHEDFERHKRTKKVWVPEDEKEFKGSFEQKDFSHLSAIGDIFFWLVMFAGIAGLVFLIYANRHIFQGNSLAVADDSVPKTKTVLGMDVAAEALPDDIAAAAMQAFRDGDVARAMRLLYAGSISWMVERERLPVRESDTEGDCIEHSQSMSDPARVNFFSQLTAAWTSFAYGKRVPAESEVMDLCQRWPFKAKPGGEQ